MGEPRRKKVVIDVGSEQIEVNLDREDGKFATTISINGVFCHLEAMDAHRFMASYTVDDDPDYRPQVDAQGHAFLLVPFSG